MARPTSLPRDAASGARARPDEGGSATGHRYRTLLPDRHFMFVYDAGRAIGAERPEALAFIALNSSSGAISFSSAAETVRSGKFAIVRPAPKAADRLCKNLLSSTT
jgi:hypothetical protein